MFTECLPSPSPLDTEYWPGIRRVRFRRTSRRSGFMGENQGWRRIRQGESGSLYAPFPLNVLR